MIAALWSLCLALLAPPGPCDVGREVCHQGRPWRCVAGPLWIAGPRCADHGAVCSVEPDGSAVCVHPGGAS